MKAFIVPAALLTGLGTIVLTANVASTVPASAKCMIDEGNGRFTPCQALYKKCVRDEGYGRYTPCEALLKPKKKKK
jgi:hypothetical protein